MSTKRDGAAKVQELVKEAYRSCAQDYLAIASRPGGDRRLQATLLRTASVQARELVALRATRGRWDWAGLQAWAEALRGPVRRQDAQALTAEFDAGWLIRMARILTSQNLLPDDRQNALALFEAVLKTFKRRVFDAQNAKVFADTALVLGRSDLAQAVLASGRLSARDSLLCAADLANPFIGQSASEDTWLQSVRAILASMLSDLEPVQLRSPEGSEAPFDRLHAQAESRVERGPLVSVIVSSWCPDGGLLTALRSLVAQSWQPLEILVVDDGSPPEYEPIYRACEAMDARIRCIRRSVNGGTYACRNAALAEAAGEFVTFQDSDDWSHPRRIELQLQPMLLADGPLATISFSLRMTEHGRLALPGSAALQINTSSLMFRKAEVIHALGGYDTVRKGADTEFVKRIRVVFGDASVQEMNDSPLAIIRMSQGSLSRSEFKPGWRHPARSAYRNAYELWHERIRRGEESAILDPDAPRRFAAPRKFLGRDVQSHGYDVVFAGDWRQLGGPQRSMLEEIAALQVTGMRIGVLHIEAYRFMSEGHKALCNPIQELINTGAVDELLLDDDVEVRLLLLRYPPILQFVPHGASALRVRKMLVVVNQAPHELDGSDLRYETGRCIANARQLFGIDPVWVPQGPLVRAQVTPLLPPPLLAAYDLPGIVDLDQWRFPRGSFVADKPVIGRYSRDNYLKFPSSKNKLMAAYPDKPTVAVKIMGGLETCRALLGERPFPDNWLMYPYGSVPVKTFLASVDFFVHFDHEQIVEAFGRSLLEAIASDCVVILDKKFEEVFGDAAIYADPKGVLDVVTSLYADRTKYDEQRRLARRHLHQHFSHEWFRRLVQGLLQQPTGELGRLPPEARILEDTLLRVA